LIINFISSLILEVLTCKFEGIKLALLRFSVYSRPILLCA